ncbi:MAG: S8 family serine peptidase [Thermotogae bacterium]|nr:S8 family serine peptidase [Thermotogota bacterium]
MIGLLIGGWVLLKVEEGANIQSLKEAGVQVFQYVPGRGYIAKVPNHTTLSAATIEPVPEDLKINPLIYEGNLEDALYSGKVRLIVWGYPGESEGEIFTLLLSQGLTPERFPTSLMPRFKVLMPPEDALSVARALSRNEKVAYVEPDLRKYLFNNHTRWFIQTRVEGDSLVWSHGINGSGEVGGVMDTGLDYYSCFFRDTNVVIPGPSHRKVIAYEVLSSYADDFASCSYSHGTHVSGTMLGYPDSASYTFYAYKGMAYMAKIVFGDASGPDCWSCSGICYSSSIYDILSNTFYDNGARVINFSWGSSFNTYGSTAFDVDAFMWDYPDALVVVASGNSSDAGNYEDGSVGSPATAKSALTVGATGAFDSFTRPHDHRAYYSSQGPTYDGRIKPEVMTPGGDYNFSPPFIASARNRTDRTYSCSVVSSGFQGTSMAAPAAAGAALLVRQYFREGWYPSGTPDSSDGWIPQGSLLKAALVASTQPLEYEPLPPNGAVGFGGINLSRVFFFDDAPPEYKHRLFVVDDSVGIQANDTAVFDITVGCNESMYTDYVKIVLSWTDAPGSYLQNDLDLVVEGADGHIYKGNIFSEGVSLPDPTSRDYLNTTEVVYVAPAKRGTWRVKVIGQALNNPKPGGYQPYSLVVVDAGPCGNNDALSVAERRNINASYLPYRIEGRTVVFSREATLYTASGRLIGKFPVGKRTILKSGVYFAISGNKTYRFMIR